LKEAHAANAAKRQFISYIFHEIRVPLNAISLAMGLIDVEDEHGKKEILEITRTQLESISTILDDSLSLQKMEEGKFEIAPKPFIWRRSCL